MPTIAPKIEDDNDFYQQAVWEGAVNLDDFTPVGLGKYPDKTLQIIGTLDGATTGLEGSMDGTNWVDLTTDGTTVITGTGMFWVWENPKFIRPKTLAGGATGTALEFRLGMTKLI